MRVQKSVCAGVLLTTMLLSGCVFSSKARHDRAMAKGKEFLEKREYSRAVLEFRNASQAVPTDAKAYYYAGMAFVGAADLFNAERSFRKAVELDPKDGAARFRLAQVLTTGDTQFVTEAEKSITELMGTSAPDAEMLSTLGFAELKLGKTDDAVKSLEQALTLSPGELSSSILLARAKLVKGDAKGAEEVLKKACAASPRMVEAQLALARLYLSQKRLGEAEQVIRHALELDSKSSPALRDLAVLLNSTERKKEAEQTFQRLSQLKDEEYNSLYALFLFTENRRDEAIREFERLAKADSRSRGARTRLVMAYNSMNRPGDAHRVLDEALKKNGRDTEALTERARMFIAERKYAEAEADVSRLLKANADSAAAHYLSAKIHEGQGRELQYRQDLFNTLQLSPDLLGVRVELAGMLTRGGRAAEALTLIDNAPKQQQPSLLLLAQRNWALWALQRYDEMRQGIDRGLSQQRLTEFLIQDGLWKLHAGRASEGRASLEEALNVTPGDVRALEGLKNSYLMQKQSATAVQKVKEYASRQPKSPAVQEFLGYVLWGSGDRTAAREAFAAAKAANPQSHGPELASVQLDATELKWDDAIRKLEAILSANPNDTTARLWLGNIQVVRKDRAAALENFRKVVEAEPDNTQALNNFAYLLAEHGNKPDVALKYAEKAVAAAPSNPEYADTLGWILYRNGLYTSAVQNLERAAAAGKSPVAKYHLAMAYAKTGDLKRARAAYDAARQVNANLPEAALTARALSANP